MVNINGLIMKGFRSHSESHIRFDRLPDESLVLGNIRANPGVDSNGAGKSSIFYAISWALFGKWLSRVKADDVINFDCDEASVKLDFSLGEKDFYIERTRGKKNNLVLFNEEVGDISGNTSSQTQLAILDLLGIDPKTDYVSDFHNAVMFSTDSMRNFAGPGMTNEERMSTLARFLKVDRLDLAKKRAADQRKELVYEQNKLLSQIEIIQGEMNSNIVTREEEQTLEASLRDAKFTLKEAEEVETKIVKARELFSRYTSLKSSIETQNVNLGRVKTNIEAEIERCKEQFSEAQRCLIIIEKTGDVNTDELDQVLNDLNEAEKELGIWMQETRSELGIISSAAKRIEEQIQATHLCPACNAELMIVNDKIAISDLVALKINLDYKDVEKEEKITLLEEGEHDQKELSKAKLETIEQIKEVQLKLLNITELKSKVNQAPSLEESIKRYRLQIDEEEKSFSESIQKTKEEVDQIQLELEAVGDIDELEKQYVIFADHTIKSRRELVDSLRTSFAMLKIKKEAVARLKNKILTTNDSLERLKPQIDQHRFWETGFPVIRRWIIESQIPIMEESINSFLLKLGMNFSITIRTMRTKKKSDEEYPDFNLEIVDSYGHSKPIETLSGGEERRIAIAVALALVEQASRSEYMSFNILMLDEVIDTLDDSGVDEFFKILNYIPQKKLCISHNDKFKVKFDKVILVNNQNGQSWIEVI